MILNIFDKLKPCSWRWKSNGKKSFGFIAQDLLELFPENEYDIVEMDKNGFYSVKYHQIIPFLVDKIREQDKELDTLRERIENLENEKEITTKSS